MIKYFYFFLIIFFLLLSSVFAEKNPIRLQEADIAIFVGNQSQSQFYDVRMDDQERPYLNVEDILKNWFGLLPHCDLKTQTCDAMIPPQTDIEVNGKKHLLIRGKNYFANLPVNQLVLQDDRLWLRYDAWAKWLPMNVVWDKSRYYLSFVPNFPLPKDLAEEHQQEFMAEMQQRQLIRLLSKQKPITPNSHFSTEARYRVDWQPKLQGTQGVDALVDGDVDVFGGTFFASGNVGNTPASEQQVSQPNGKNYYLNYTFRRKEKFALLQFGDTYTYNDLLLPYINLKYGVNFSRLEPEGSIANGFKYQGYTMPNIEVDVYRNGILQGKQFADANGSYSISQPFAMGGDIFEMRFYYTDGRVGKKTVVVSDDQGMIVAKNNWNFQLVSGELYSNQWFSHVDYRYGVADNFTMALHALALPMNNIGSTTSKAGGAGIIDFGWRPAPWIDVLGENMGYQNGDDYVLRSEMDYFKNNTLQIQRESLSANSPIPALQNLQPVTFITPYSSQATQSWLFRDIYNYQNWRFSPEYNANNISNTASFSINGPIGRRFALTVDGGTSKALNANRSGFFSVQGDLSVGVNKLLQMERTFSSSDLSSTAISYRFQGTSLSQWNLFLGVFAPDRGTVQFSGTINYRPRPWALIQLSGQNNQVLLQLSLQGIISSGYQYKTYSDFGSGTITGVVFAPVLNPGDLPKPMVGVVVRAGGRVAKTDKNGQYVITGVPTNQPVQYSVDSNSIDADYIPDKKIVMMQLRPSTTIQYNPQIDYTAGIDGVLIHESGQKIDAVIVAKSLEDGYDKARASADEDGFFILDGLTPGRYELRVESKMFQLKSQVVEIPRNRNWLSNVKFYWGVDPAKYLNYVHPLSFSTFLKDASVDTQHEVQGVVSSIINYGLKK